jgi:NADH-quinone oxidoreductase subunit C
VSDESASVLDILRAAVPDAVIEPGPATDMPTVYVDRDHALDVVQVLRDDPALQFALLVEITAADYHPADPRFEVVYHFACLGPAFATADPPAPARRLRVKVRVAGADPRMPSITSVYPSANWLEREVFDLFGVSFDGHPDLRRILMPDEWDGHPARKDYAVQIRKDTASWSALQLTAEEFASNVQAQRDRTKVEIERSKS